MDKEKFEKYIQYLNNLEGLGIISNSTYLYLSNEAYQKLKSDEKLDAYCNYHILRSVVKLKKRFDTSYWATSPEISPDAPESISSIKSMDVPETPPKPAEMKPEPFWIEMNGVTIKINSDTKIVSCFDVLSNSTQIYYNSKELRPITRKQYAAKIRWARLRGLKSNRPEKYCFVKIAEYD